MESIYVLFCKSACSASNKSGKLNKYHKCSVVYLLLIGAWTKIRSVELEQNLHMTWNKEILYYKQVMKLKNICFELIIHKNLDRIQSIYINFWILQSAHNVLNKIMHYILHSAGRG